MKKTTEEDLRFIPPPHPVNWLVEDPEGPNKVKVKAQTAFKAYQLANLVRKGIPLSFGEVRVSQIKSVKEPSKRNKR